MMPQTVKARRFNRATLLQCIRAVCLQLGAEQVVVLWIYQNFFTKISCLLYQTKQLKDAKTL